MYIYAYIMYYRYNVARLLCIYKMSVGLEIKHLNLFLFEKVGGSSTESFVPVQTSLDQH